MFSICFCDNILNETLWLKYGDFHKGFVMEYDYYLKSTYESDPTDPENYFNSNDGLPYVYPIYYSNTRYNATNYLFHIIMVIMRDKYNIDLPDPL